MPVYPEAPPQPSFPTIEEKVLARWAAHGTFARSVDARAAGDNEYVFYDGPPFANGLPHYGHLLTGFVKDVVPRYQTMRGRRVERRFGWDCHGLPAEVAAERERPERAAQELVGRRRHSFLRPAVRPWDGRRATVRPAGDGRAAVRPAGDGRA